MRRRQKWACAEVLLCGQDILHVTCQPNMAMHREVVMYLQAQGMQLLQPKGSVLLVLL